jgi:ABC-2 type transport system ATP-binding protein
MSHVIDIKNFSKWFGDFQAVKSLSFQVSKGEIFGFLGRNGAGKTTTIRSLIGIYEPDEGDLEFNGCRFDDSMKDDIGYLPEERGLYLRATVQDTIMYFARLKGLGKKDAFDKTEEYLKKLELYEHRKKKIQNLSSGMQQKVQIIITVIHQPKILILDEPFRGLDPVNRQLVFSLLQELKSNGTTILFSSHQISEIEDLCDRCIMIASGESRAYGTIEEIKSRFEPRFIRVRYQGQLPHLDECEWCKDHGNHAELKFKEDADPQVILTKLLDAGVRLELFEICKPSLHEIFIQLCDEDSNKDVKDSQGEVA